MSLQIHDGDLVVPMGGNPDRNNFNPFFEAKGANGKAMSPLAEILHQCAIGHVFVVGIGLEYGVQQACVEAKARLPRDVEVCCAKCRMPNAKCRMPNAKCQMPNAECQMPNAKCRMPNAECQMPNAQRMTNAEPNQTTTLI